MEETLEVLRVVFIAHDQPAEVEEPGKESLDFPAPTLATQGSAILRAMSAQPHSVGSNHLRTVVLHQRLIQPITIVGPITDQSLGDIGHNSLFQRGLDQLHFRWRSTFRPQGERKTMAVGNTHDFAALAPLGLSHQAPPFLAGTNVPSTKHSLRSNPPASWRCWARARRTLSNAPERTQFWKRRCAVWYGPYRGGKSFQGAPVRRIHNTPLSTLRRSLQGRPRPSSRTGSSGRMASTTFHCSSVRSIHNYLYISHLWYKT